MLKFAICEDEPLELEQTQNFVSEYCKANPDLSISVTSFLSSESLLDCLKQEDFNIYLLDIIMDGKNGIEVGAAIRKKDKKAVIIYLSSSPDYALASYSVDAQYYQLKPIEKEKFSQILNREIERLTAKNETYIAVRTKAGNVSVCTDLILYVEQNYHIFTYHLTNNQSLQSVTSRTRFDQELSPLLNDSRFVKISSSLIVNMSLVQVLNRRGFVMNNGTELPIARSYTDARLRYTEYILQRVKKDRSF